ncbi:hypothetical protein NLI96_g6767 [Meripilus lineatus]|uniref:Uncharacterized protein n=1 Tax=Meripilus lineatus TaxID=2056292 RepID=A0AAD5V5N8_9APHY|nr:hypothetical protein NLI96_g6767 [Physisporinus lineatus]
MLLQPQSQAIDLQVALRPQRLTLSQHVRPKPVLLRYRQAFGTRVGPLREAELDRLHSGDDPTLPELALRRKARVERIHSHFSRGPSSIETGIGFTDVPQKKMATIVSGFEEAERIFCPIGFDTVKSLSGEDPWKNPTFFARRRDRKGAGGKGSEGEEKRLGRGIQELMMAGDLRVVVALEMELYLYKSSYQYAPMSRLY